MAQRLLRLLCKSCKNPVTIDDEQWFSLIAPFKAKKPAQVYQAVGCLDCRQTGYLGRIGIYEILTNSLTLKKLMTADSDNTLLQKQAIAEGMRPLRLSAAEKVAAGLTSIDEMIRVAPETMEF